MAGAWTPGPWVVHSRFKDYVVPHDAVSKPIGGSVYDKQDRDYYAQTIVRVVPDRHGRGDDNANARLIAAAPDMAEALEVLDAVAIDRAVDAPEWRDKDTVSVLLTIGELRAVRAALAKARGEA